MNKLLISLLIIFCLSAVWPQSQDVTFAVGFSPAGSGTQNILEVAPAESVFVLQINNFQSTISMVDQYLMGISPMPMAVSMLIQDQLGGLLNNPQLNGINMDGAFGIFVVPPPGRTDPNASPFIGVLVPVTDYNLFISSSPNCEQPDAEGVSLITTQTLPPMVVKQAAGFALVTIDEDYDALVTTANAIASGRSTSLAGILAPADSQEAAAPVWAYIDVQQAVKIGEGPLSALPIGSSMPMPGSTMPDSTSLMPGSTEPMGPGTGMDLAAMAQDIPIQSVTISLTPKPDVLTMTARITAIPGTDAAQTFVRDSADLRQVFDAIGAKQPSQAGPELSAITALLPTAQQADVVGTFNLMNVFGLAAAFSPIPLPELDVEAKSSIAYAVTADAGKMAVDIALPKEHLTEIVAALKTMEQPVAIDDPTAISLTLDDTLPVTEIGPGTFGSTFGEITPAAPVGQQGDGSVRVAGVRLVRYSDLELGVLPLGHGDGYTLALIAQLPAPAVKVAGGEVQRAVTDTGRSLLPERLWDRKIKFARLSRDNTTAVFDVELILPDQGASGLEELSGILQYLTASGTRDVDLGVLKFEVGAKSPQLGAGISSIEADPYRKNATVMGLDVDLPPEAVKSVEFLSENGAKLDISQRGYISVGGATTLKFSIRDQLPPTGRIVLSIYEDFQKNELPFKITGISLAGQPLR